MTTGNRYFRVIAPTEAFLRVGHYPSNTYAGASQMYGTLYRQVTLQPGDEIHKLVGGTFIHHDRMWSEGRQRLDEKHPFEKTYLPVDFCVWPDDVLEEFAAPEQRPRYRQGDLPVRDAAWVYEHCTPVGRSIDYIVREDS